MFNELLNEVNKDKKKQIEAKKTVNVEPGQVSKNVAKKEADDI